MRGFDDAAKDIVKEATELGWVGRPAKKGHIVMRAPDGVTTATLMPKVNAPRARQNQRAPIERWKRENPEMVQAVETKPKPKPKAKPKEPQVVHSTETQMFTCDHEGCTYQADTTQALRSHKLSSHSPVKVCPECGREFTHPGGFGNHMKMHAIKAGREIASKPKKPAKRLPPKKASIVTVESMPRAAVPDTITVIDDVSALNEMTTDELQQRIRTGHAAAEVLLRRLQDAEAKISLIRESINI